MLSAALLLLPLQGCQENLTEEWQLSWNSETLSYRTDIGGDVYISAEITATDGLDIITVDIPAWSSSVEAEREVIEITGSPRKYSFNYEVQLPDDAEVGEYGLSFTLLDYSGNEYVQKIDVIVASDDIKPELEILSPEEGAEITPDGTVTFEVSASDNLKMKEILISCEKLAFEESFLPVDNEKEVTVDYSIDLNEYAPELGDYEFVIKAVDAQLNDTSAVRTVKVAYSSKPRITYGQRIPVCGVSGGTLPFRFKIETNDEHTLKSVQIICGAIGLNETVLPEQETSLWEMDYSVNLSEGIPAQQNVSFTLKAVNDIDETTEYTGTLNVIENVYLIGRGTLALEKEGQAILMEQDAENPDVFSAVTWINRSGLGVKFLSEPSWNAFNWGLDSEGDNIVSPESNFIPVNGTGYYKCSFNPVTWEYSLESVTADEEPITTELYLFGDVFSYWNESEGAWTQIPGWSGIAPFKRHPDNPHCFYIDVKTGPANSDVALWKIFGQTALEGEGLFYGVNAEPDTAPGGSQYVWQWWEYCGPAYRYSTFDDISYFKEGSRTDAVMRLTVDTWLGYMSWMPLKEQQDAGWEIYPELYTPIQ